MIRRASGALQSNKEKTPAMYRWFESLLNPFPPEEPVEPPRTLVAFCLHYTRGSWPLIAISAVLTSIIALTEVWMFGFLGNIVDWLTAQDRETFLQTEGRTLAGMAFVVLVFLPGIVWFNSLLNHQTLFANYPMRIRWQVHRYLLGQSMTFYQDEFAGRIATKLMQTALAVRETVIKMVDILNYVVVYFLGMLVLVGAADWRLALPLAGWLVGYVLLMRYFIPRLGKISQAQADARSMMTGRIVDSYTNIATVKLFSHAGREAGYARSAMKEFMHTVHGQMRLVSGIEIVNHTLSMLLILSTAGVTLWLWTRGEVGVGAMAAATAMALRLNGMSHWVMWEMASLFENVGTVQDGINTLSRPHAVVDRPDARPLQVSRGEVRFERVDFAYGATGEEARRVIEDFSLVIRPGEKIGLVGRSGAGKSTLVNLLLRFHDLEGGRILVDGQDIAGVTQESLRAAIGMVTQDTSLLHRSVRDNIRYGSPEASEEAIQEAVRRAHADTFIDELVDLQGRRGLDAHVGERGVKLSGGQRQRIAIARVLLKNAPILVLDEATSALDSEVESAIQEQLYTLMEGKTVIAIAHRLSTIAMLDRLVVIDEGRIVESGTHRELLERGGLYAALWRRQSGGFIGVEVP